MRAMSELDILGYVPQDTFRYMQTKVAKVTRNGV